MSIKRTQLPFEGNFVQIPNAWMRDKRLSRRARGLLAELMTHRANWVINIKSLWETGPEGRESVRKALLELHKYGYLKRAQSHGESGQFAGMDYELAMPMTTVTQEVEDGDSTVTQITAFQLAAPQESAPKNNISKEDQVKEENNEISEACWGRTSGPHLPDVQGFCITCGHQVAGRVAS